MSAPVAEVEPFWRTLESHGLSLGREEVTTLQVNVGYLCNLTCRHCHLEAGPGRREVMTAATMTEVVALARKYRFATIDITGGAPELNPRLPWLVKALAPLTPRLILRSNLTALAGAERQELLALCGQLGLVIVASFPSLNELQAEAQRGRGVFATSLMTLKKLNALGYGCPGSGLELDLVANPVGAFMPPNQAESEKRFRQVLGAKWELVFNQLYMFANVPLGRFRHWLAESGNLEPYRAKLVQLFNPCAVAGVMCRSLLSVAWDGALYDCDFHQAAGIPLGGRPQSLATLVALPPAGTPIPTADHCYACTAGAGFT
jgi:radical SAM/Cys-rich protein